MKLKENKKLVVILIFLVILLVLGGTFAAWTWTSNNSERTMVSVTLPGATLTIEGDNVTHTGMYPTAYCDGEAALIGEVATATGVNATNVDVMAVIKIRSSLTVSHSSLTSAAKEKLNWAIVDTSAGTTCETTQYRGNFSSVSKNTDIDTGISFVIPAGETVSRNYRIYVWLDSTYEFRNHGNNITNPMDELNISVKFSPNSELVQLSGEPEVPVLDDGMIPVKIANNGVVTTVADTDESWYNYDNKEWANVVLVKNSGTKTRSYYKSSVGVTVNQDDILAYYVWIPRYKYRIKDDMKCSELDNPSINGNLECYLPFVISDNDKDLLINWLHSEAMGYDDYTVEEATEDVETMLSIGKVYIEEDDTNYSFIEILSWYNEEHDSDITYTDTYNGNNIVTGPSGIDISFEPKIAQVNNGNAVKTYKTHPAFIFGGETIGGIWVGKFETSTTTSSTCYTSDSNCDNTNQEPRILPNVKSLRHQTVSNQFQTSLKFAGGILTDGNVTFDGSDIYGLTVNSDSHMMKNSEWGAVAYLSHSKYGINQEIYINNSDAFYTGRSGGDVGGKTDTSEYGTYSWTGQTMNSDGSYGAISDSTLGTKASTTGNVTGVYDMSGGASEYVMGVLSDTNGNPRSGWSGFNGLRNETPYTSGITFPDSKYYDLYLQSQFNGDYSTNMQLCTLETCGGHALNETANWYRDSASFVFSEGPWFLRGGDWSYDDDAGAFYVNQEQGSDYVYDSWRSVLIVD